MSGTFSTATGMLTQVSPLRSQSPEDAQSGPKRRKRKALSCYDCRRRKLRCDRECPCTRCQQEGHPETCVYNPIANDAAGTLTTSSQLECEATRESLPTPKKHGERMKVLKKASADVEAKLLQQERRIAWLEDRIASFETAQQLVDLERLGSSAMPTKEDCRDAIYLDPRYPELEELKRRPPVRFKGNDFETQYWGSSNPMCAMWFFIELLPFMKESFSQISSLKRVQGDMKALKNRRKASTVNVNVDVDSELANLVPRQDVADQLVTLYFAKFETTYRIIHKPSFMKDYHAYWNNPLSSTAGFVVTMLLVMATVNCMSMTEPWKYVDENSSVRETAKQWIRASESWIQRQSHKHSTAVVFQARCLVILARQINSIGIKQQWAAVRTLISYAMTAGLHQDPQQVRGNISIFHQEIRRRLWATMIELDLHISLDRGLPSFLVTVPQKGMLPVHINDEEIQERAEYLPNPVPLHVFTATSYLLASQKSIALRISLNSIINESKNTLTYEDILMYDDKINAELRELPVWARDSHRNIEDSRQMAQILLDLQLRQFLILLHGPVARKAESNSRYNYSRMVLFSSCKAVIDQHHELLASGNPSLCLLRHDIYLAALYLCHNACLSNALKYDMFSPVLKACIPELLEYSLSMLEDKVMRLGTLYNYYWHVSAAYSYVQSTSTTENLILHQQQAVDRVTRLYYKALASQDDLSSIFPYLCANKPRDILPDPSAQFQPFDPLDLSGWTLDNLWTFDQELRVPALVRGTRRKLHFDEGEKATFLTIIAFIYHLERPMYDSRPSRQWRQFGNLANGFEHSATSASVTGSWLQ